MATIAIIGICPPSGVGALIACIIKPNTTPAIRPATAPAATLEPPICPPASPRDAGYVGVRRRRRKGYADRVTDEELSQLMRAAQASDAVAYTSLLEAIAPRIRRGVGSQRHFAGTQEVEDLVQDVLLSVHAVRA